MLKRLALPATLLLACLLVGLWAYRDSQHTDPYRFFEKPSGAAAALDYWNAIRAYPEENVSSEDFERAFFEWKSRSAARSTHAWKALGPNNFGGRSLVIAFNPQNSRTIWLGSASGGLWRTQSGGEGVQAWEAIETGFPVLGVPAVAVHPRDSNTLIIGTGEVYNYQNAGTGRQVWRTRGTYGIGILKTTDGGATWGKVWDRMLTDMTGVQYIAYHPQNPDTVFAATTEGVLRSSDGGDSWSQVWSATYVSDLRIHPREPWRLVASVGNLLTNGRGVYYSENGGDTWQSASGLPDFSGKIMLGYAPSQPNLVYASIGYSSGQSEIYRSEDFGKNWRPEGNAFYTYGWFAHDIAVNPTDPNDLTVSGVNTFKYDAQADTIGIKGFWYKWFLGATQAGGPEGPPDYVHADVHDIQYAPGSSSTIYYVTDGGLFRSQDNGNTFEGLNGGLQCQQFYPGGSNTPNDSNLYLGGLQDNATAAFLGDGNWYRLLGGDGGATVINPFDTDEIIMSTQWTSVWYSNNFGDTYARNLGPFDLTRSNFIGPVTQCQTTPTSLYAGTDTLWRSNNFGQSWTNASAGLIDSGRHATTIALAPSDCQRVYVATSPIAQGPFAQILYQGPAQVLVSENGGQTLGYITAGLPDRATLDLDVDPNDADVVYAALGGYGVSHLWRSRDGGQSWTDIGQGLPDVPFNTVVVDPLYPQQLFAGCDLGVFYSADSGATWQNFSDGLIDATLAMDLTISSANRKLRMLTHGRGAYEADLPVPSAVNNDELVSNPDLVVYPNPAQDGVWLEFALPSNGRVGIELVDLQGRNIRTLMPESPRPAGPQRYAASLEGVAAGTYLVRFQFQFQFQDQLISRKLNVVK